jgi:hypothetical protein
MLRLRQKIRGSKVNGSNPLDVKAGTQEHIPEPATVWAFPLLDNS